MMAQAVWMCATQGFGNLWPLRVGFSHLLAVSAIASMYFCTCVRR